MEWLVERLRSAPEKIAFIHEGREFSYGKIVDLIATSRKRLQSNGIQKGNTVVVLGDYSPELFCVIIALCEIGGIVIPLTKNSVVEQSDALAVSGCDWYIEFNKAGHDFTITYHGIKSNSELLDAFKKRGTPGVVLFSSGSTGQPKGILHDFVQIAEKFRNQRSSTVAIPFLAIDHFGGINTILSIISRLGTVVTVADRSVQNICSTIEKYRVELLPATPSFLTLMLSSKLHKQYNLSSLKRITYGTEVMPQSTLNRLVTEFPNVVMQQTYGLSEVGVLSSQSRDDGSLWVRIGGEGFKTKIVNGVLWIKSKYAMVGYLNAESKFDTEGWFNTQDQVEVDGEYFRIIGRETDIINVGGQKVYPSEVEDIILEMNNIQDVAVFGEKHSLLGQIVVAKVILDNEESAESIKKRIRAFCANKLAKYKIPAKVILSEDVLYSLRQKKIRRI